MKTLSIAFPILPDKLEQAKQFAAETLAHAAELAQSFARMGVHREEWFIQNTPQGAMVIVTMEANDPAEAFARWARSNDPFDCWFKTQAQQISGIDFNQPLSILPEKVFSWIAS